MHRTREITSDLKTELQSLSKSKEFNQQAYREMVEKLTVEKINEITDKLKEQASFGHRKYSRYVLFNRKGYNYHQIKNRYYKGQITQYAICAAIMNYFNDKGIECRNMFCTHYGDRTIYLKFKW